MNVVRRCAGAGGLIGLLTGLAHGVPLAAGDVVPDAGGRLLVLAMAAATFLLAGVAAALPVGLLAGAWMRLRRTPPRTAFARGAPAVSAALVAVYPAHWWGTSLWGKAGGTATGPPVTEDPPSIASMVKVPGTSSWAARPPKSSVYVVFDASLQLPG